MVLVVLISRRAESRSRREKRKIRSQDFSLSSIISLSDDFSLFSLSSLALLLLFAVLRFFETSLLRVFAFNVSSRACLDSIYIIDLYFLTSSVLIKGMLNKGLFTPNVELMDPQTICG